MGVTDTRQVNKQKKRWGGSCLQPMHAQLVANQSILQRWFMLLTENHGIEDVSSALLEDAPMSCLSGACTRPLMATTSVTPAMRPCLSPRHMDPHLAWSHWRREDLGQPGRQERERKLKEIEMMR